MFFTDDAERDFDRYDREMERRRARRPVCSNCGEHIQDEEAYLINSEFICQKCLDNEFKIWMDDYTEK